MSNEQQNVLSGEVSLNAADFIHDPYSLRTYLTERDALRFSPHTSGLLPASYLPEDVGKATKMDMSWIRDNAHALRALIADGQIDLARGIGTAFLQILENNRALVDAVNNGLTDKRFPVRVDGNTLENDKEDRRQNDSVGYLLWGVAPLLEQGIITSNSRILGNMAALVQYVDSIKYWQDYDHGHWEEDVMLQGPSIGAVLAGLRDTQSLFSTIGYKPKVDIPRLFKLGVDALSDLMDKGLAAIGKPYDEKYATDPAYPDDLDVDEEITQFFENFDIHRRQYDAAMMFLVRPLGIVTGTRARGIVTDIETHLERERGHARYIGDTYWGFGVEMDETTRTHQAVGRLEWRNQFATGIAYLQAEAQWTLLDPLIGDFWSDEYGEDYLDYYFGTNEDKYWRHLGRSLKAIVPVNDGTYGHPENFYYTVQDGKRKLVSNQHTPLIWPRANFLYPLRKFEKIFSESS